MSDRHDLGRLAVAITSYLTSKYFTELAPSTQRMRRNLLNNMYAEVERLSANEITKGTDGPSETPAIARDRRWHPRHRVQRSWITA